MNRFRFRLETLLKLREDHRRQRRAELAEAFEAEKILQLQADGVAAELAAARTRSRDAAQPGELNIDELIELGRHVLQLQAQRLSVAQRQARIREEVERRREVLAEADRQVRMLEKLREKQQDAYLRETLRQEQKELDELAVRVEHEV